MNEVIEKLCRIKTQYAINKLNPSSTDMIFIQYEELCLELNKQLQSYKQKEDKLREYITSYESISIIQGLDNIVKNKGLDENTMIEMTNRYLEVHDNILQILNEGGK